MAVRPLADLLALFPDNTDGAIGPQALRDLAESVAALAWPVGSVYVACDDVDPAVKFGFGTWVEFAQGRVLVGKDATDVDFDAVGKTGGGKAVASAGAVGQPAFAGTPASLGHAGAAVADHASHTHGVTSNVAVADHAAHTHGVTSAVSIADHASHTHAVTSAVTVADHASHTHAVTSAVTVADHADHTHTFTQVPNHVHVQQLQGGTTAATTGTHLMGSAATGGSLRAAGQSTANPTGGVATATTAGASAALNHTVTNAAVTSAGPGAALSHAVTNGAVTSAGPGAALSHTVTNGAVTSGAPSLTLAHTITNTPVTSGAPSLTLAHTVTQPDAHAYTPQGVVSQPAFTGAVSSVVQPFAVVRYWRRAA